ncbi:hypothetical protein PHYPO_G00038040 [Pangasianodon hypophthalmus]|uniref:Ig-like domain-containing protein n=1 Tax=Pangasianodon hypophthalmus TaxID=310915 RepID=A0A5N5ML62_PANHP|nr:hypothetical protein PHYPO_G00038040 [Pangasianodon hypophthalmus]
MHLSTITLVRLKKSNLQKEGGSRMGLYINSLSCGTEVIAGTCLIRCVLIQVLLIIVYGKFLDITVNCPNQTGTEGEPLHLTCSVTCKECKPTNVCKWSNKKNPDIKCSDEQCNVTTSDSIHTFHCTIPHASEKLDGTFKFWVQMTTGTNETTFSVTIVPSADDPTTPDNADIHNVYLCIP